MKSAAVLPFPPRKGFFFFTPDQLTNTSLSKCDVNKHNWAARSPGPHQALSIKYYSVRFTPILLLVTLSSFPSSLWFPPPSADTSSGQPPPSLQWITEGRSASHRRITALEKDNGCKKPSHQKIYCMYFLSVMRGMSVRDPHGSCFLSSEYHHSETGRSRGGRLQKKGSQIRAWSMFQPHPSINSGVE